MLETAAYIVASIGLGFVGAALVALAKRFGKEER